ncbi:MAG: HEAT repeat domain-containing protein [Planctomycetes bacterium]|nr:HEAT repeat domain-containing protein [Planctomycetota bacterium]
MDCFLSLAFGLGLLGGFAGLLFSVVRSLMWGTAWTRSALARPAWKAAAAELGLDFQPRPFTKLGVICGTIRGITITVKLERSGFWSLRDVWTRISLFGEGLAPNLSIEPKGITDRLGNMIGQHDLRVGDEEFDRKALVAGSETEMAALLDKGARERVVRLLIGRGARLEGKRMLLLAPGVVLTTRGMVSTLRELLEVAELLTVEGKDLPSRLADHAVGEWQPEVRYRNLAILVKRFPGTPEALRACREVAKRDESRIRVLALRHLQKEGLTPLAELVESDSSPEEYRLEALEHLLRELPRDGLAVFLERLIGSKCDGVRKRAFKALLSLKETPPLELLVEKLAGANPAATCDLVRAIGRLEDPNAEAALLPLLEHADPQVKTVVSGVLGRIGTIRAVEPLLACARGAGGLGKGELGAVARFAVKAIQRRLGEVDAGRLSVVEGEAEDGALSLAEGEGALSLEGVVEADGARAGEPISGEATLAAAPASAPPQPQEGAPDSDLGSERPLPPDARDAARRARP